jgi:cytochrome c peroxidase
MRKYGMLVCAGVALSGALTTWLLLRPQYISGQTAPPLLFGPIPCQGTYPDQITLAPAEKLGKLIIYDCELSDPPARLGGRRENYACATCHMPQTGFMSAYKDEASLINLVWGPVPGPLPGRAGNRTPKSYAYVAFRPIGPFFDSKFTQDYIGGAFWDGRVPDLITQAMQPFLNPNEMNNTPANGIYPPVYGGYSTLISKKVTTKYRTQFEAAFGPGIIERTTRAEQYVLTCMAAAAFMGSAEVNQFSSKFDASKFGVPPQDKYTLTDAEERGRVLFFGKATCNQCHSASVFPPILDVSKGKDTFSCYAFSSDGVPKNPKNPFYLETNPKGNPHGYNPEGAKFLDYGLGANPNLAPDGKTKFFNKTPGDIAQFRGLFQIPPLRGMDLRPHPLFVKAFMHNGVFKSLKEVVHFYNKRNIAVNDAGKEAAFDLRTGPPAGYKRLFPPPELVDNVENVQGTLGNIGNLGLTERQEHDIVAFLKILNDGFTKPNGVENVIIKNVTVANAKKIAKQFPKAKLKTGSK